MEDGDSQGDLLSSAAVSRPCGRPESPCHQVTHRRLVLRPALLPAELAAEKIPFLTEVDLLREDSQRNILDRLLTASAGPAFAASTGEPSRLAAPDLTALAQLQKVIVVPGRISVALAGDIDREDARSVVNACFPDTPGAMLKRTSREPAATTRIATLPLTMPGHVATGVFIPTSSGKSGTELASAHASDLAVMNVIHQALRTQLTTNIPISKNAAPTKDRCQLLEHPAPRALGCPVTHRSHGRICPAG